jgi:hypothetical protein
MRMRKSTSPLRRSPAQPLGAEATLYALSSSAATAFVAVNRSPDHFIDLRLRILAAHGGGGSRNGGSGGGGGGGGGGGAAGSVLCNLLSSRDTRNHIPYLQLSSSSSSAGNGGSGSSGSGAASSSSCVLVARDLIPPLHQQLVAVLVARDARVGYGYSQEIAFACVPAARVEDHLRHERQPPQRAGGATAESGGNFGGERHIPPLLGTGDVHDPVPL